jgi:hypothetical protein
MLEILWPSARKVRSQKVGFFNTYTELFALVLLILFIYVQEGIKYLVIIVIIRLSQPLLTLLAAR